MTRALTAICLALLTAGALAQSEPPDDRYPPGPDSQRQASVPEGAVFHFRIDDSKVFPGTSRDVAVYVPAQYKPDKPACVYVGLDGLGFEAPVVFDNLIHKGQMPVTIGVGLSPGQVASARAPEDPRFNRSFEFDSLDDSLARFVLDEVLPAVQRHAAPDGRRIVLSDRAADRCAGGGSTGGIGAFTLAWERPDAFTRVFSAIGTFVGMRGGDRYPVLVRKTEPRPIRIFMQDGSNDEWMGGPEVGDWWMGNQAMERALAFAGYDVRHVWGHGTHNGNHATQIFPDAMRFLWAGWPEPVKAGESQNTFLRAIVKPDESWKTVESGKGADELLVNQDGDVFARESDAGPLRDVAGNAEVAKRLPGPMAFGSDGRAHTAQVGAGGRLIVTHAGAIFATDPGAGDADGRLWLIDSSGKRTSLDAGLNHPSAVALSPDGLWLAVLERTSHWGYSYRVGEDGTVSQKQRFYWLHVPDTADDSGARAACFDRDGRLYVATRMGVQVLDRNGRTRATLPLPGHAPARSLAFGGRDGDLLYVAAGGNVYVRRLNAHGWPAWSEPIKLPPWSAG